MLDIITIGDDVLRNKSETIDSFGSELQLLVDAMAETMQEEEGVGLAAPQVGVAKRLFITNARDDQLRVFINPEIIETSQEQVVFEEGCLSVPGVYAEVIRPQRITIQAFDVKGKAFTLQADGLLSRVIQHEYDHIRGILFVDRLDEQQREKVLQVYNKRRRKRKK